MQSLIEPWTTRIDIGSTARNLGEYTHNTKPIQKLFSINMDDLKFKKNVLFRKHWITWNIKIPV